MTFDEVKARYIAGETAQELTEDCAWSARMINHHLKKAGIPLHNISYVRRRSTGYTLDEHAFDVITPDAAYWAGFLITDGCVHNNRVHLCLAQKDHRHLEKFRDFLGSNVKITAGVTKARPGIKASAYSRIGMCSAVLASRLAELGITPRKSRTASLSEALRESADCMRGVLDGDGHIKLRTNRVRYAPNGKLLYRANTHPVLELYGAELLLTQFRDYAVSKDPTIKSKIAAHNTVFRFRLVSKKAQRLIEHLYTAPSTVLDRKMVAAQEIIAWGRPPTTQQ